MVRLRNYKSLTRLGRIRSRETAMYAYNEIMSKTGSSVKFLLVIVDKIKNFS